MEALPREQDSIEREDVSRGAELSARLREREEEQMTEYGHYTKGSIHINSFQMQNTLGRVQIVQSPRHGLSLDPQVDRKRCAKWFDMLEVLKNNNKVHSKLKTRARKGIPDSIRGIAWPILAGVDNVIPAEYAAGGGKQEWLRDLL